jgi:hypothetical protein
MSFSNFPVQTNAVETYGMIRAPETMLQEYRRNPLHVKIVPQNHDLKQLRNFYKEGYIKNVGKPSDKKSQNVRSKAESIFGGSTDAESLTRENPIKQWVNDVNSESPPNSVNIEEQEYFDELPKDHPLKNNLDGTDKKGILKSNKNVRYMDGASSEIKV